VRRSARDAVDGALKGAAAAQLDKALNALGHGTFDL